MGCVDGVGLVGIGLLGVEFWVVRGLKFNKFGVCFWGLGGYKVVFLIVGVFLGLRVIWEYCDMGIFK